MRWVRHVEHMQKRRDAHRVLVGKPEERLGRPTHRWEDNTSIKMDLHAMGWGHGLD